MNLKLLYKIKFIRKVQRMGVWMKRNLCFLETAGSPRSHHWKTLTWCSISFHFDHKSNSHTEHLSSWSSSCMWLQGDTCILKSPHSAISGVPTSCNRNKAGAQPFQAMTMSKAHIAVLLYLTSAKYIAEICKSSNIFQSKLKSFYTVFLIEMYRTTKAFLFHLILSLFCFCRVSL